MEQGRASRFLPNAFVSSEIICEWSAAVSCAFRMAEPVYGIDDFPDDDSLWRVEWIGGVGYNTSVPSDRRITVCSGNCALHRTYVAPHALRPTPKICLALRTGSQSPSNLVKELMRVSRNSMGTVMIRVRKQNV